MEETGTDFKQHCPLTGGDHKYFISKTLEGYAPFKLLVSDFTSEGLNKIIFKTEDTIIYAKREFAILGCNCGSAIKKEIEKV